MSEEQYTCRDRTAIWAWTVGQSASSDTLSSHEDAEGDRALVTLINSNGEKRGSWELLGKVAGIVVTDDCRVAWIRTADSRHIYSIDRDIDRRPIGTEISEELHGIRALSAAQDGIHAWVRFNGDTPIKLAERKDSRIDLIESPGIASTAGESDIQPTYGGKSLWVIPRKKGIWLVDKSGAKQCEQFRDIEFEAVFPSDEGRLGWLSPTEKGLYLIDNLGNAITLDGQLDLLPNEEVRAVHAGPNLSYSPLTAEYAWVTTNSHNLYCFKAHVDGTGKTHLQRMNNGQPISFRPGGEPLHAETIKWIDHGVWVEATPSAVMHDWQQTFRLVVNKSEEIVAKPLERNLYKSRRPTWLFMDFPNPNLVWIRTSDFSLYEIDADQNSTIENPFKGLVVTNIFDTDRPGRLWVNTSSGMYLVGPASDLASNLSVQLGGNPLVKEGRASLLRGQLSGSEATVSLKIPGIATAPSGKVTLSFVAADSGDNVMMHSVDSVALGEGGVDSQGRAKIPLFVRSPFRAGAKYAIDVAYTDNRLFDVHLRWASIAFRPAWYQHPYIRACGLLFLPIIAFSFLLQRYGFLRRWVPVLIPGLELTVSKISPQLFSVAPQDLIAVVVMALIGTLITAVWSPPLLRTLAVVHPYRALVPFVMQVPIVKERFFSSYIADLRATLTRLKSNSSGEAYIALPCSLIEESGDGNKTGTSVNVNDIERWVVTGQPEQLRTVLIEAPGGRGKSALMHELITRAIGAFERDSRSALPVIGDPSATSADDMLRLGLGRHALSTEYSAQQLAAGEFVIFVDAVDGHATMWTSLETLFHTPGANQNTRICAATRPLSQIRQIFYKSDRFAVVRPERLDEKTVEEFVVRYANSDAPNDEQHRKQIIGRLPMLLRFARSADGTYLPLLVRFAMLLEQEAESIADLYQGTLDRLLSRVGSAEDSQKLQAAAETVVIDSYWKSQERTFSFDRATAEATSNIAQLLQAGILIEADRESSAYWRKWRGTGQRSAIRQRPYTVRFLHDSMQSYLAAKALFSAGDWEVLFQAAGDPAFTMADSELLPGMGSELFQMCVHVFRPEKRLCEWATAQLLSWSKLLGPSLAVDQIREAVPSDMLAMVDDRLDRQMAAGLYLHELTEIIISFSPSKVIQFYGALSRTVWPLRDHLSERIYEFV